MLAKLVIIVVIMSGFFISSLIISYEGFQLSPNLRTQHMSFEDVSSICSRMDSIMQSHNISYEHMIRLLNDEQLKEYLTTNEITTVEHCLQGRLPELSSFLVPIRIGFFEGMGSHDAKGTAKVLMIEKNNYLRLESFEIDYVPKNGTHFQIPELHVYLSRDDSNPEIYLDKLQTKLGSKNYKLPSVDLNVYDTILIVDQTQKELFAKVKLHSLFYLRDIVNSMLDNGKTITDPKISSQAISEQYGFLNGVDNYAKGTATVEYHEDEGELNIQNFEISHGEDLQLYLTKNNKLKKSGYWTIDSSGFTYVSSGNTDQVLRYAPDGTFLDIFVDSGSGGLDGPKGLAFSSDQNFLYVASFLSNDILRYDLSGDFIDAIISSHDGNIFDPKYAIFGSDNNLYVSSNERILRFDGLTGKFLDIFVDSGSGGLELPTGIVFGPDGNLYVSSGNTDQVLRYAPDGTFLDIFVDSTLIKKPHGLTFGPDNYLYVASSMTDDVLRFNYENNDIVDIFASDGGLSNPIGISFDDYGNLYVSSGNTDQVLRYAPDGTFLDIFVDSTLIKKPHGLTFGPDNYLYVVSSGTNEIVWSNEVEAKKFVTDLSSALSQPQHLEVHDNQICVNSYFTNDIQCYDENTGTSIDKVIVAFNRSLISRDNSIVGPDGNLYVPDDLRNKIFRYSGITGLFSDVAITTDDAKLIGPSFLTVGPDENLYVSSNDRIFRFDITTGNFIDVFVPEKSAGLLNPRGLSFDTNYLYVSSSDNNRVLRYDSETGNFIDEFVHSRDNNLMSPVGNELDDKGIFYVSSPLANKILSYDTQTGKFLNEISLPSSPYGLVLEDNFLYISMFDSNEILAYDLDSKHFTTILSDVDGLDGPADLAFDSKNNILYVSSIRNSKIIAYDLQKDTSYEININSGDGILQRPQGLLIHDNSLFIANTNNNEILKYDLDSHSLNIFIYDTGDLIRPGGITFGPDSYLYVINKKNNQVYRYDVDEEQLLDVFTEKPLSSDKNPTTISLRSITFSKDGKYLFASNPPGSNILTYDVQNRKYIDDYFKKDYVLQYPTDLTLTPDGKYILVIDYAQNIIIRFTVSGNFDQIFVEPGKYGLTELSGIRFGPDGNLYVMGGTSNEMIKYDGIDGSYLGKYDDGGTYLGKLTENPLNSKYLIHGINPKQNNVVTIYDHFLERPYAKIDLYDKIDILTPLDVSWNSITSYFNVIQEPKLQSQSISKHTGFFVGIDDIIAYGQVITHSVDFTSIITIENFSFDYHEDEYVSTTQNIFTPGPLLETCLVLSSDLTCNHPSSIELGKLFINAGDNRYVVNNVDLDKYNTIVIYDRFSGTPFAHIPLRDYGILRISGESFVDWLYHDLSVVPMVYVIVMIFPVFFDYIRGAFKILFFTFYLISRNSHLPITTILSSNKKITILIPAHNEEYGIKESIESALATDYANKEIIVIDDGSKDNTWIIANHFAEKGLIKLIHRDTASGSKATALNYGLAYASGDYILCMDGDTLLDKSALKNTAKYFNEENTVAFSGNVKILAGDMGVKNILTRLQAYEYMIAIELGRRFTSVFRILLVISGAFGIFRKDVIKGVHTFDKDTLTEDFDLTLKFRKTRGRIRFVPDSIAYTYCPSTWSVWVKQRNRWAYGQFQTLLKNKNIISSKFPIKDKISFVDMFVLDIVLSMLFPVGLTVLGIITTVMFLGDNLHVLVYPLTFVVSLFMILECLIFLFATIYSRKYNYLRLVYLAPIMTFFYRPYLKMVNLRAYLRAYFKKGSSW